jgi:hypothetical protein
LTGAGHRSDRWSTGSKPCMFPLCVLVCFGSEGCVLVPRSSSTSVAAWAWPTWVVSQRRVLEAVFILLESPSPSRRIFIGSHSLPPSLVCRIGPSTPQGQIGHATLLFITSPAIPPRVYRHRSFSAHPDPVSARRASGFGFVAQPSNPTVLW